MRVLAIDPGTTESAYLRWDSCGKILGADIVSNAELRHRMIDASHVANDFIAIEMVACYGMPVGKEVFETCVWIGRFWERCGSDNPTLIYRRDVKLHHCGSARAKDANIRQALIDKYGAPGTKKLPGLTYGLKSHLWSAFAIATYISETHK